jgi:hypothetical protein
MVVTGAARGIMEAGHQGAGRMHAMGLNILLPFEQESNAIIHGDPKLVYMKYFFTRKLMLVKECDAVVCLPGGFGTIDEAMEVLTLLQTGKRDLIPVVQPPRSRPPPPTDRHLERLTGKDYSASSPLSPVRMRITFCRSETKILPSPISPVGAAPRIVSTTFCRLSSAQVISSLTLGTKSTVYSFPRYRSVCPFWRPKPRTSMPVSRSRCRSVGGGGRDRGG